MSDFIFGAMIGGIVVFIIMALFTASKRGE